MTEKVLNGKNNGMTVLLLDLLMLVLAIVGVVFGGIMLDSGTGGALGVVLVVLSMIVLVFGWIPLLGLRVLKPQEALVVTLFGKYVGTLKGDGFACCGGGFGSRCIGEYRPYGQQNIPQDNDPQQQPTENKRLPRQPR